MRSYLSPFGFPPETASCWAEKDGHWYYSEPPTPSLVTGSVTPCGDDDHWAQAFTTGRPILDDVFPGLDAAKRAVERAAAEAKERPTPDDAGMLPCPFCGFAAPVADETPRAGETAHFVRCRCCAAEGPWAKSRAAAVTRWNWRSAAAGPETQEAGAEDDAGTKR